MNTPNPKPFTAESHSPYGEVSPRAESHREEIKSYLLLRTQKNTLTTNKHELTRKLVFIGVNSWFQKNLSVSSVVTCILFSLCLCVSVVCCGFAVSEVTDRIIAVVNDEVITQSELDGYLKSVAAAYPDKDFTTDINELGRQGLMVLIEEKLILQEAKKHQIEVKDGEVLQRIEKMKNNFASEEEFSQALNGNDLTMVDLQAEYKERIMMQKLIDINVRSQIDVTPLEVSEYYDAHEADFNSPESVRLSLILIRFTQDTNKDEAFRFARLCLTRLKKGADFYKLARKYSQGPNAAEGGMTGPVERGQLIEELDKAVFMLNEGDISEPIETKQGYYIAKIEKKLPATLIELTDVSSRIEGFIYRQRFDALYKEWINRLKEKAFIQIML